MSRFILFNGEFGHTFMEFVANSGDYCQAQHCRCCREWDPPHHPHAPPSTQSLPPLRWPIAACPRPSVSSSPPTPPRLLDGVKPAHSCPIWIPSPIWKPSPIFKQFWCPNQITTPVTFEWNLGTQSAPLQLPYSRWYFSLPKQSIYNASRRPGCLSLSFEIVSISFL